MSIGSRMRGKMDLNVDVEGKLIDKGYEVTPIAPCISHSLQGIHVSKCSIQYNSNALLPQQPIVQIPALQAEETSPGHSLLLLLLHHLHSLQQRRHSRSGADSVAVSYTQGPSESPPE